LVNGVVNVVLPPPITITNIILCKTIVCQGYTVKINVTTLNEGDSPQTFNLTIYYNSNEIGTQTITQTPGTQTTTFTWNTTGIAKYINYTISAETAEGFLTDGTITVVHPGDVNGDKVVDIFDLVLVANAYGSSEGDPSYIPKADINDDGTIDIFDLVLVSSHYGETDL